MRARQLIGGASALLGAGVALAAALGPLGLGVIRVHVSDSMQNQLLGGELVSLCAAAPLAVAGGVLWWRGRRLAPALVVGPAVYAVYTYVQFIAGPQYERYPGNNERAFPLYLALIVLGWAVATRAWAALDAARLPAPPDGTRRALGGLLVGLNALFALAWAASIAGVLRAGGGTEEYLKDPALFWLVRLMDLGFVIPLGLLTGVGLLRRAPWATRLAYGFAGFQTLLVGAVAAMAAVMVARDDPAASPALLAVTAGGTLALAIAFVQLLRHAQRPPDAPQARVGRPAQLRMIGRRRTETGA